MLNPINRLVDICLMHISDLLSILCEYSGLNLNIGVRYNAIHIYYNIARSNFAYYRNKTVKYSRSVGISFKITIYRAYMV